MNLERNETVEVCAFVRLIDYITTRGFVQGHEYTTHVGKMFSRRLPAGVYYYAWLLVLLRFVLPLPGFVPVTDLRTSGPAQVPDPIVVSEVSTKDSFSEIEAEEQISFANTA